MTKRKKRKPEEDPVDHDVDVKSEYGCAARVIAELPHDKICNEYTAADETSTH